MRRSHSMLSPRNARALAHRIVQAGPFVWSLVREDHPHEEDSHHQQQRQCLNDSHDRPSLSRASVAVSLPLRVADGHARDSWSDGLGGWICRSGRIASSTPAEQPRHDDRPDRDHEPRGRARDAVYEIAGHGPEEWTKNERRLRDVHDAQRSKSRSRGRPCDFSRPCVRPRQCAREVTTEVWIRDAQFGYPGHLKELRVLQI